MIAATRALAGGDADIRQLSPGLLRIARGLCGAVGLIGVCSPPSPSALRRQRCPPYWATPPASGDWSHRLSSLVPGQNPWTAAKCRASPIAWFDTFAEDGLRLKP
jgi:hypothetical protein